MNADDYDLLAAEFPSTGTTPPPQAHAGLPDAGQHAAEDHGMQAGSSSGTAHFDAGPSDHQHQAQQYGSPSEQPVPSLSKHHENLSFLTEEQKKDRLRWQNKKAAERSRAKKRGEQEALGEQVLAMQEENERLRQRIAALRPGRATSTTEAALTADPAGQSEGQGSWTASANAAAVPDQGEDPSHPAIDQTFFVKLQAELSTVKQSLLDKQLELARLQGTHPDESSTEAAAVRQLLLQRHLELLAVRAESEALGLVVNNLRDEMDESVKQREEIGGLLAVVDGATGYRPDAPTAEDHASNDGAVDRSQEKDLSSAAAVPSETMNMPQLFEDHAPEEQTEKALIELGGWVEQAVQDWAGGEDSLAPHRDELEKHLQQLSKAPEAS